MAITAKPKKFNVQDEKIINSIIEKGGDVPSAKKAIEKDVQAIRLIIPGKLLKDVDESIALLPIKRSRVNWILEAMYEKLQNEKKT